MADFIKTACDPWLWKMAWRDSRTHRKRLFLFMTTILLGIAALVSIGSFGKNLARATESQAKTLLGADLMFASLEPFSDEMETLIDSLGGEQARETLFGSMAYFTKTEDTRLVQIRALEGEFPFYGKIGAEPKSAIKSYQSGPNVLVDEALMLQFDAQPGDTVRIGESKFIIAARLTNIPNQPPIASTFSPRIYLPAKYIDQTQLLQRGSLVTYQVYFKFPDETDVQKLVADLKPVLDKSRIRVDTVKNRQKRVGRIMENLYRFLNLVGFVALILGSIGVGSAVHVYVKQKLNDVAVLRCLGAKSQQTFWIYLIQVGFMAFAGSLAGALLGVFIQLFLPDVFSDFLPVDIEYFIAWDAVGKGVLIGLGLSFLFGLLPLLSIRNVSPLLALRASFDSSQKPKRDVLRWVVYALIIICMTLFAISQTANIMMGIWFTVALIAAFLVLAGVSKFIVFFCKRFFPKSWPYVWRQGLANLYRPNNQTLILMLSVGLGTFLITTLYLSHDTLLQKVSFVGGGDRPNLILFDIQPDQKDAVVEEIRSMNLPLMQEAPMVTMRLQEINGESIFDIISDSTRKRSRSLLRWEFRTTYRDSLFESEEIVAGNWVERVDENLEVIPISFDEGIAQRLKIALGDTIVWDVQGVPLTTKVASLRKVDWQRIQANFMVVFPEGALNYAPQIYILATRVPDTQTSAELQRKVNRAHPNVSMIDLALILSTLDGFLEKISFVIRFMAFFSIFTGLIVLTAAVITSRFQRVHESILLRTLGASRKQITKIMAIEYLFLGSFAAITGLLLSYICSWALAYFAFDSIFVPTFLPFILVLFTVASLTVLIGMLNSRGILDRPPLEVLRLEA